jgi:hypothetical protein
MYDDGKKLTPEKSVYQTCSFWYRHSTLNYTLGYAAILERTVYRWSIRRQSARDIASSGARASHSGISLCKRVLIHLQIL